MRVEGLANDAQKTSLEAQRNCTIKVTIDIDRMQSCFAKRGEVVIPLLLETKRKGNIFLRSVTRSVSGRALAAVREAAVHRLLDAGTETTSGRAGVKTRPQNSHVVKLESSPQLTKLSDLRCADRGR